MGAWSSYLSLLPSCPETIRSLSPGILPQRDQCGPQLLKAQAKLSSLSTLNLFICMRQGDCYKCKSSLGYRESSRTARATKMRPCLKTQSKRKTKRSSEVFCHRQKKLACTHSRGIVFAKERNRQSWLGKYERRAESNGASSNSFSKVTVAGSALLIRKRLSHLESTYPEISVVVCM